MLYSLGSDGAKRLLAKFESMAQSSNEEDKKRVEEERARRAEREQKERASAKKREEVS